MTQLYDVAGERFCRTFSKIGVINQRRRLFMNNSAASAYESLFGFTKHHSDFVRLGVVGQGISSLGCSVPLAQS